MKNPNLKVITSVKKFIDEKILKKPSVDVLEQYALDKHKKGA